MSQWYYFTNSKGELIDDGGYAGIPNFWNYDLEKDSPCDSCENKDNESEYACWGCYKPMKTKYKITRAKLPELIKNMDCNKDLFEELMNKSGEDFIWISSD